MMEIKSDKIITPNGLRSGYLYIDNGLIDGFFEKQRALQEEDGKLQYTYLLFLYPLFKYLKPCSPIKLVL